MARSTSPRPTRPLGCLSALVLAVAVAACGAENPEEANVDRSVEHAFGVTELSGSPDRVVTLGWGSTEAALALGVEPIAVPNGEGNGGIDGGLHPWVVDHLDEEGLEEPTLLSVNAGAEPPYEEIAALEPDLILAAEAGLDDEQYERLSKLAPTIAHPGEAWETPWRDVVTLAGEALGSPDEAEEALEDIDALTASAAQDHPEFDGLSITAALVYDGELNIATASEPRSQLLEELGFSVDSYGETGPWHELSLEEADEISSDVLLMYFQSEAERREFEQGPAGAILSQYRDGRVATVVGAANVAAVSPPTALSWSWTIDDFVDELARAAENA